MSLELLTKKLVAGNLWRKEILEGKVSNLRFALGLLFTQSSFIVWTIVLGLVDLAEVWILLERHHTFFVGSSFLLLRISAVLRLLPFVALLGIRLFVSRNSARSAEVVVAVSQLSFVIASFVALGMVTWLSFGTHFYVSASPFVRAIILSGIIAIPLEALIVPLLFNLSLLTTKPLQRNLRIRTFALLALSLLLLWAGVPAGYLIVRLLSFLVLIVAVIRVVGVETLIGSMSIKRLKNLYVTTPLRRLVTFCGQASVLYLCWEFTFINWTAQFRNHSEISLLIFVVHKASHLSSLLTFRFLRLKYGELASAVEARAAGEIQRVLGLIEKAGGWFVVGGILIMLPITLMKERIIMDQLPLGMVDSVNKISMLLAAALFLFSFVAAAVSVYGLCIVKLSRSLLLGWVAGFILISFLGGSYGFYLAQYDDPIYSVALLFLLSTAINGFVRYVVRKEILSEGTKSIRNFDHPIGFQTFSNFLDKISEPSFVGDSFLRISSSVQITEGLIVQDLKPPQNLFFTVLFGRDVIFAGATNTAILSPEYSSFLARIVSRSEQFKITTFSKAELNSAIEEIVLRALPPKEGLSFDHGIARSRVASEEFIPSEGALKLIQNWEGVVSARRVDNKWHLPHGISSELQKEFIKFMGIYEYYKDPMHVACLRGKIGKLFFVDLNGDNICWIPPQLRSAAVDLQGKILRQNMFE